MCETEFVKIKSLSTPCLQKTRLFHAGRLELKLNTAKDGRVTFCFIVIYHIRFEVNYWINHLAELIKVCLVLHKSETDVQTRCQMYMRDAWFNNFYEIS